MQTAIWLHPWDLEGWEPAALVDRLRGLGLDACHLALAYHATRFVLPTHRVRRVLEIDRSAIYFAPRDLPRLADWTPPIASSASLVQPFLEACRRAAFPVRAWLVLCHQDGVGADARDLCVTNVYGDRYAYALCPSQPAVRTWCAAICAEAAMLPGIDALDLEAASFLGIDHQSAHDKRGVTLPPAIAWLLSICVCDACRREMGGSCADDAIARARRIVDMFFRGDAHEAPGTAEAALGDALSRRVLDVRERAQTALIAAIRERAGGLPVMLRVASSPFFSGGKSTLSLTALPGIADAAVMTWLGADLGTMRAQIEALPPPGARPVPLHGGFTLHAPDCRSPADVAARLNLLREAEFTGAIAYAYGLAAESHLTWLRMATQGGSHP